MTTPRCAVYYVQTAGGFVTKPKHKAAQTWKHLRSAIREARKYPVAWVWVGPEPWCSKCKLRVVFVRNVCRCGLSVEAYEPAPVTELKEHRKSCVCCQ